MRMGLTNLIFDLFLMLLFLHTTLYSQVDTSVINFYPHQPGNVWQYHSQFTGDLIRTVYTDSVVVDSVTKDILIYNRQKNGVDGGGTSYETDRIDSLGNVFDMTWQPNYVRYKLYADSGDSWQAGVVQDTIPVIANIAYIYQANVSESTFTTVKAVRFQYQTDYQASPFIIGTDHIAAGIGLIKSEVEPSDVYVLTGAIINGMEYGNITSVINKKAIPQAFDLLENYPNPFNNGTRFVYSIAQDGYVNINLYDVLGRLVRVLIDEKKLKGKYEFYFTANTMVSGIYFVILKTNSKILTHKILFIK